MPSLLELQRALRLCLIEGDDSEVLPHVAADELTAEERLAIYRNTVHGNLVDALRLSYPAVHRLVGAQFFDCAARAFTHRNPPSAACLDDYGAEFAAFLACFPPAASLAYLPDVARLEWAVTRALHAADAGPLDATRLAGLDPDDHHRVRFVVDPSITLLRAAHPADAIWRAVLAQDDAALARLDVAAGPVCLLVERRSGEIEVTRLDDRAWQFADALLAGQALGPALDEASSTEAAALLAEHLAAGRFIDYSLAGPTTEQGVPETG